MNGTTPALIAAAAGVGLGHAIMPDHWVPLAVVGRTRRYPLARVARLSGLAGIAHVLVSLLLGGVIIAVGLQFRSTIAQGEDTIVGAVLIATGVAFTAIELTGRGHSHSHSGEHGHHRHERGGGHSHANDGGHRRHDPAEHRNDSERGNPRLSGLAAVMVPFGAAASPDLTILPVFLAATAAGAGTAIGSLIAFALATIVTIVVLTVLAAFGGRQLRGRWLERWGNVITAATLIIIGTLVLTGSV